ncbi:MAG: ATPase inhibitor subunit zeta [Alphaproteobacteria bacterium]
MTSFQDRQRAEEKKFQLNKEQTFKATMRGNRLFAEWLAGEVKSDGEKTFDRILHADFEESGSDDVIREAMAIAKEQKKELPKNQLEKKLAECYHNAKQQVASET